MGCFEQNTAIDPNAKKTPVTAENFKSITKNNYFEVSEDSGVITANLDVDCGHSGVKIVFVECKNSSLAETAYTASKNEFLNTLKRNSIGTLNEKEETFQNGKKYTTTLGKNGVTSYVYLVDNTVIGFAPFRCKEYQKKVDKILSEFKY